MSKRLPHKAWMKVFERSHGMCEGCGKPGSQVHHRRFRGRGGEHNLANLVMLCGVGNTDGCHGRAHGAGNGPAPEGWAISQFDRRGEASIPFTDMHGVTWFFDDDGNKETDDFKELE